MAPRRRARASAAPRGPALAWAAPSDRTLVWAELLRLPALFTVPGDALAGAAATAAHPNSRTLLAIGSSLCLYAAGMALNDWADHEEDARERPHRPLPSGRIRPAAALTAACTLTGAGLALAARAGRPALTVAAPLAATVWAYDLALKHTPAGPAAMATARALDLLLGAAATTGHTLEALPSAALLGTHTLAVTTVSRQETQGGSPLAPLAALATTVLLARLLARRPTARPPAQGDRRAAPEHREAAIEARPDAQPDGTTRTAAPGGCASRSVAWPSGVGGDVPKGGAVRPTVSPGSVPVQRRLRRPVWARPAAGREVAGSPVGCVSAAPGSVPVQGRLKGRVWARPAAGTVRSALAVAYAATAARPYFHAALNPSPPLTQRAVAGGIRATVPLQAALTARSGAGLTALFVAGLAPLGRRFGRKVSVT